MGFSRQAYGSWVASWWYWPQANSRTQITPGRVAEGRGQGRGRESWAEPLGARWLATAWEKRLETATEKNMEWKVVYLSHSSG